jgi:chaperonin GroES
MLQPTYDHVLVEVQENDNITAGGIILTDNSASSKIQRGKVLAIGPGMYQNGTLIPVRLSVGSTVSYLRGSGIEIPATDKDEKALMLREGDVFGVE